MTITVTSVADSFFNFFLTDGCISVTNSVFMVMDSSDLSCFKTALARSFPSVFLVTSNLLLLALLAPALVFCFVQKSTFATVKTTRDLVRQQQAGKSALFLWRRTEQVRQGHS